jgi:hypothetical protein
MPEQDTTRGAIEKITEWHGNEQVSAYGVTCVYCRRQELEIDVYGWDQMRLKTMKMGWKYVARAGGWACVACIDRFSDGDLFPTRIEYDIRHKDNSNAKTNV